jgi:hypothetical protein
MEVWQRGDWLWFKSYACVCHKLNQVWCSALSNPHKQQGLPCAQVRSWRIKDEIPNWWLLPLVLEQTL